MRLSRILFLVSLPALVLTVGLVQAQSQTSTEIGCQGTAVLMEDFEGGIPGTWTVWDADGLTPNAAMGLVAGWQSGTDYTDDSNQVALSPSWYSPAGVSDDWIASPAVMMPTTGCLSWSATSVDGAYAESYEVRLATSIDTAGLRNSVVIDTVNEENELWTIHSLDVSAYAGLTRYIVFHQISDDRFVLALDNVVLSAVNSLDIGVYELNTVTASPGDTVTLSGRVMNYGTDTITSFTVSFQIEGGIVFSTTVDSVAITLNNGRGFVMNDTWITEGAPKIYDVCVFSSAPNGGTDMEIHNDSLCKKVNIGNAVGVNPGVAESYFSFSPNPADGELMVVTATGDWTLRVLGADGRECSAFNLKGGSNRVDLSALPGGIYFLQLSDEQGHRSSSKLILY